MLRVNLIGQQLREERTRRASWTACLAISGLVLISTAFFSGWKLTSLIRERIDKARLEREIAANKAEYEEVRRIQQLVHAREPLVSLAREVQVTASRWVVFIADLTKAVPVRTSGLWLTSVETKYNEDTYKHTVQIGGSAQHHRRISEFQQRLTEYPEVFNPLEVEFRKADLAIDEKAQTQRVDFTIEATLSRPIGGNFQ